MDVLNQDQGRRRGAGRASVSDGLDRFITQIRERPCLLVIMAPLWCSRIGLCDQLEVGFGADQIAERGPKLPDRLNEAFAFAERATKAEVDGDRGHTIGCGHKTGIGRQFVRNAAGVLAVEAQYLPRSAHRVDRLARQHQTDRVQLEFEGRDNAEVSSATAHAPEQVGMGSFTGSLHLPISGDDVNRKHVVNGQPVLPHHPTRPTAEGEAREPGPSDGAGCGQESKWLDLSDEFGKRESSFGPYRAGHRINADALHLRKVDDDALIANRLATDTVTASPDGDGKILEARKLDRTCDVGTVHAADDQGRISIDHAVPDPAGALIATIVRADQFATQTGTEGFQIPELGNGDGGTGGFVRLFSHETSSFSCKSRQTRHQTRVANRETIQV